MDNFRGFEDEAAFRRRRGRGPAMERPPEIGVDERRMHVRAYNYWVSLLAGRPYPSIQDVDPTQYRGFRPAQRAARFLARPGGSRDRLPRPRAARRMRARRRDPPYQRGAEPLAAVAAHRPLSADHRQSRADRLRGRVRRPARPQHALSRHPDAAVVGRRDDRLHLRRDQLEGDGRQRDRGRARRRGRPRHRRRAAPPRSAPTARSGPTAPMPISSKPRPCRTAPVDDATLSLWPDEPASPTGCAPRATAPSRPPGADQRSRAALYRALGLAYDFALAAEDAPDDYAELLDDAGIKAQARAPMTPVVKLVFGAGYDKTRLTEFAAALSWAKREGVPAARSPSGSRRITAASRASSPPSAPPAAPRRARPLGRIRAGCTRRRSPGSRSRRGEDEFVLLVARRDGEASPSSPRSPTEAGRPGDPQERRLNSDRRLMQSAAAHGPDRRPASPAAPAVGRPSRCSFDFVTRRDRLRADRPCSPGQHGAAATISRRRFFARPRVRARRNGRSMPRGVESADRAPLSALHPHAHSAFGMRGEIVVEKARSLPQRGGL